MTSPSNLIHTVLKTAISPPFAPQYQEAIFGMGCFWGVERLFWKLPGVHTTAVGYAGGRMENPTYKQVCTGTTGHVEVVRVVYDPEILPYSKLLTTFWENHDPTQGNRQGNDIGEQYKSVIYTTTQEQYEQAVESRDVFEKALKDAKYRPITTEIKPAPQFWLAEEYHQQYLDKNPNGYCGLKGTGVSCPYVRKSKQ